jgi:hypothetical protein
MAYAKLADIDIDIDDAIDWILEKMEVGVRVRYSDVWEEATGHPFPDRDENGPDSQVYILACRDWHYLKKVTNEVAAGRRLSKRLFSAGQGHVVLEEDSDMVEKRTIECVKWVARGVLIAQDGINELATLHIPDADKRMVRNLKRPLEDLATQLTGALVRMKSLPKKIKMKLIELFE